MATVRLYIRSKETGKMATLWVRFTLGRNKDYRRPTYFKVPPEYWDPKKQEFKSRVVYTDIFTEKMRVELSDTFKEFKQYIQIEAVTGSQDMSNAHLQTLIDKFNNIKKGQKPETLNSYIDKYIEEIEKGERLTNAKKSIFSPHTIKAYRSFQTQFNNYQKGRKRNLNFNDITIDFYDDFVNFFYDKNYSPNSVGKLIKILKIIMREAREEGHHQNGEFERKKFKVITIPTREIYLTEEELRRLFNIRLHNHKSHALARDIFLVGCYTAQRFSDYSRIRLSDVKENEGGKVIELTQQKTGERVVIPCRTELLEVLKKIGNNPPPIWEQKVNKYIKTVARAAKIKNNVTKETLKGGLKTITQEEKCNLIKTHTARRTGCTLMYLQKNPIIPVHDIMKISGHKTEKEFLKYIRVSQEETALRLASHPYFIGNPLSIAK